MSHRLWLNCLAVVLIIPGIARAGIIYVNNIVGDDRANGQFPDMGTAGDGPVATLARALQLARGTDSIAIANTGEAYLESVTLDGPDLAGTVAHPFVIEGNGAVLRGTRALPASVWRRVSAYTYSYQPYRKGHYQLVVDGKLLPEINSDPASATPPSLEPLTWCAHRGMVYFRVEPTRFIDQYEFEVPQYDVGLGFHNARNVIVRNLNIEQFRLDGVAVTGNSRNIRLLNIRSTGNGRAGLSVSGTSQVQVGGLDVAGNRVADRLELLMGKITDLPQAQVPPRPIPVLWDLNSGRYVQILSSPSGISVETARTDSAARR